MISARELAALASTRRRAPRASSPIPPAPLAIAVVVSAAFSACSNVSGDSADVFGDRLLVASGPELRIGAVDDPDYAFGAVRALAVRPDGEILYSLHRNDAYVRLWTRDGEPAGTIGGEGEGPGEFTRPGELGFFGDSLWVMDTYAYRVSFFDLDGRFLGSMIPQVDLGGPDDAEWSPPRPERPLRDGSFIGRSPGWSDEIARGLLTRTPFVRMTGEGESLGTIWMQPLRPHDILALLNEDGVGGTYFPQPFADGWMVESDQRGLVVVDRRVWQGEGDATVEVMRIDLEGDTAWSTSVPYTPVALPRESVDSAVSARAQQSRSFLERVRQGTPIGAFERELADAVYAPEWAPAVRSMLVAEDGSVWLERFSMGQGPGEAAWREWWIVGPDGAPAARAHTPEGLRIILITGDALWGVERDELEVEYIVRYELSDAT